MNRDEPIAALTRMKPLLAERYGVTRLALFGSTARNEAGTASDLDVLVAFDGPTTAKRYFGVLFALEDRLGRPIDLVSQKALRAELRPHVERDLIDL